MKILKIEFRNINSLRDTHSIDFTVKPFTTSSLFAITGPTGSGKSTILDVISLALFNQIPRMPGNKTISKTDILKFGAILTRNQQEAFAKVTYECKSGIYTSEWSISTARTGNLRDFEMQISKEPVGEILDIKKSDVPGKNEQLIGLSYNQFIKSVLLAQGEFSQFLKAKKEERGELLEKITGTGIYRQLGRRAFEKFREVNQRIQQQQDTIAIIQQGLLEDTHLLELTAALKSKEKTCEPLEKEIEKIGKSLDLKKTIKDQLKEIEKLARQKESSESSFKAFLEEYGPQINNHEKVREIGDELRDWKRLTIDCAELDKNILHKKDLSRENLAAQESYLKEVSQFTNLEIDPKNVETKLENFASAVRDFNKQVEDKLAEFKGLQQTFKIETRELNCTLNEKEPEKTGKELATLNEKAVRRTSRLKEELQDIDLNNLEVEKFRLKRYLVDAREAWNHSDQIERIVREISKYKSEEAGLLEKIKGIPAEIRHNDNNVKLFQEKLKNIRLEHRNRELQASLQDHRTQLVEGEPCPLCGALHHPYAAGELPEGNDDLETQLSTIEAELSSWMGKLTANTTSLTHYDKHLDQIRSELDSLQKDLDNKRLEFEENFKKLGFEEKADWKNLCDRSQVKLEKIEEYEKEIRSLQCVQTALPLIKQMQDVSKKGKDLRAKLDEVYSGKDINADTRKFHNRWTEIRELEKGLFQQLFELQEKTVLSRKKLNDLETGLWTLVIEKGFGNIPQAGEALLPDNEYFRLHDLRAKLEKEIERTKSALKILNSQVEKYRKEDVEHSADELYSIQQEKKESLSLAKDECEEMRRTIKNHFEDLKKLELIKEEIAEKEKENKRWKMLDELIGDSKGKKFNDFAQDLSLSQLLLLANIRLKDLSDRYRIAKPAEDEDDGLVAIDEHMGGQRRSVKTLSGGETFILSLSMALALSDLASRNVEINSLFIDEGFGTLDPETLDQTLDTLEKLQAESSKTIGIISHVDSLKERIATQIKLKRHGQGYSTLEITG